MRVFDAFGTEVVVGDWIYYTQYDSKRSYIGQIKAFNPYNQPIVQNYTSANHFAEEKALFEGTYAVGQEIIKCYNQPLIETLESLIK